MKQSSMIMFAALVAAAAPHAARADQAEVPAPVGKVTQPAGWTVDVGRSKGLELATAREDHFGGVPVVVSAQQLTAPVPGGLLLFVEVATEQLPADVGGAAASELAAVRGGVEALGETAKIARWDVAADEAARLTEANLAWSDASLGTSTFGRTLLFQSGGRLVRLEATCILGADASALRAPCEAALATLAPLAPVADRVPFTVAAAPPAAPAPLPGAGQPLAPSSGPMMSERSGDLPLVISIDQPKPKKDRRPLYVGGGLLLIAAAYFWNRRNRARLEAENAAEHAARPAAKPADEPTSASADADEPKPSEEPKE